MTKLYGPVKSGFASVESKNLNVAGPARNKKGRFIKNLPYREVRLKN
jgi:hypothetical protein